jgi:N6-adenosine-specific RNA methylase IME4
MKTYEILYCDPPWNYKGQTQHGGTKTSDTGSAQAHYPTMTLDNLKCLNVDDLASNDSLLFMWSSSPHLDQAIELMKAWGFKYSTIAFVWDKVRVNPSFYTMSQVEICIVGKKGKIPNPRGARNIRQFLSKMRGKHSEKPNEVRERIEKMFPFQSKIELFARTRHVGWDSWGNEVKCDVQLANSKTHHLTQFPLL